MMKVDILKSSFTDNFFYLIVSPTGEAALIDPIDAERAQEAVRAANADLKWIINTHFHGDHVGGDDAVAAAFPAAQLAVPGGDRDRIAAAVKTPVSRELSGGDAVELGELELRVLDSPGHTPGHISLLSDRHLFCGDTIFVGGAGNCRFGGDPGVLFHTFRDVLGTLGDDVLLYPGHDYSVRNIEFGLSLEPDNPASTAMLERASAADGLFQTTLGEERTYNPFLRFSDPALEHAVIALASEEHAAQTQLAKDAQEALFRTVRALRNNW